MSSTTALMINATTGLYLVFFTLPFLIFIIFILYTFFPVISHGHSKGKSNF